MNSSADNFRCKRALEKSQTEHAGPESVYADNRGDYEVEQEKLDEKGGVSDQFQVDICKKFAGERIGHAKKRCNQSYRRRQYHAENSNFECDDQPRDQAALNEFAIYDSIDELIDPIPLPVVLHRLRAFENYPADDCDQYQ